MSAAAERVLVLSVGMPTGQPVDERGETYALRQARPDFVVFVCSRSVPGQPGSVGLVDEYRTLTGLAPEQVETLVLDDPDDLVAVYERASALLERLRRERPYARILVDYTAGTKSMCTGLAMAAVDQEDERVELRLVKGRRGSNAIVVPGTESFRPVSRVHDLRAQRRLLAVRSALQAFDYAGAALALDVLIQSDLSKELADQLQRVRDLCRAFDAWDRWDLERAEQLLAQYRTESTGEQPAYQRLAVLEQLRIVRDAFEGTADLAGSKDPYLAVEDLLFNAERRAAQARYDDAVARVYRALELLAQQRLRVAYAIDTADVDLETIPAGLREELAPRRERDGTVKIGLLTSWRVLAAFPDDPLGRWFAERERRVVGWIRRRNASILAHGLQAIGDQDWATSGKDGLHLCRDALDVLAQSGHRRTMRHAQFPREELLAMTGAPT